MIEVPPDQIWMVVIGFLLAFVLAFGIGANDVANSFGTSVGSGVLNMKQAFVLACIFETLGSILIGAKVSDTIRKGIIDVEPYKNNTELLMIGNIAALSGSCIWLIAATLLRLPVSATHSIVGSTVGFALVAYGAKGIHWHTFTLIIGSWFISPLLAGGVSIGIFCICKFFILNKRDPLEPGLRFLPVFYAATITINVFSVFYNGPEILRFNLIPLWGTFIISFGSGIICAIVVRLFVVPWQRKVIKAETRNTCSASSTKELLATNGSVHNDLTEQQCHIDSNNDNEITTEQDGQVSTIPMNTAPGASHRDEELIVVTDDSTANNKIIEHKAPDNGGGVTTVNIPPSNKDIEPADDQTTKRRKRGLFKTPKKDELQRGRSAVKDEPETGRLFSFLQVLTAIFGSFAHGGNDVSNAIGPLVSLWLIGTTGQVLEKASTPIWILLYGGFGISLGLCIMGNRVIKTLGEDLTKITPSSGFCIEIGSALTVLISSNVGIPISTTHCKVGSVVFVGRFRANENVDWSIFRNIVLAWLVTLPVAGGVSAAVMAALRVAVGV